MNAVWCIYVLQFWSVIECTLVNAKWFASINKIQKDWPDFFFFFQLALRYPDCLYYCKDESGDWMYGFYIPATNCSVRLILLQEHPNRNFTIVIRRRRTAARSFSCRSSSASFLPSMTLPRLVSFERARVTKARWRATSLCGRPGILK